MLEIAVTIVTYEKKWGQKVGAKSGGRPRFLKKFETINKARGQVQCLVQEYGIKTGYVSGTIGGHRGSSDMQATISLGKGDYKVEFGVKFNVVDLVLDNSGLLGNANRTIRDRHKFLNDL